MPFTNSQRKFHSKSRLGCLQCKKNHTKCDEKRPHCGRCVRIGVDCSLAGLPIVVQSGVQSESINPRSSGSPGSASSEQPGESTTSSDFTTGLASSGSSSGRLNDKRFADDERTRLRLMHNYTVYTSKTVAEVVIPKEFDPHIWSTFVPELALDHDYLLHGLFSLSALHLALQGISRQESICLAIHHHDLGSALFRPYLNNMTTDHYEGMFGFSTVTVLYSFGILRLTEPETDTIQKICQIMTLTRGAGAVIKFDFPALRLTRWNTVLIPQPFQLEQEVPIAIQEMFSILKQRVSSVPATQQEIYNSTIEALGINIRAALKYGDTNITMTLFPVMISPEYWILLRNGDYLALALVANYAVILYWLRKNIWMEGWGKETICAVREALPADWHDCIAWAVREIESD